MHLNLAYGNIATNIDALSPLNPCGQKEDKIITLTFNSKVRNCTLFEASNT